MISVSIEKKQNNTVITEIITNVKLKITNVQNLTKTTIMKSIINIK